jgi:hypothetical protein
MSVKFKKPKKKVCNLENLFFPMNGGEYWELMERPVTEEDQSIRRQSLSFGHCECYMSCHEVHPEP